jgi:[NiFe] hydrogenase diaphorase moiety small subunit
MSDVVRTSPGSSPDARESFTVDGQEVEFTPGMTILQALLHSGTYVPSLCYHPEFKPHGSCRVCTVKVNGRATSSCTAPA